MLHIASAKPLLRPRVVGDSIVIGNSTVLGRRYAANGCWEVEKPQPAALSKLLSIAYEKRISPTDDMIGILDRAFAMLPRNPREADHIISGFPSPPSDTEEHVAATNRLLKSGIRPDQIEAVLRGSRLGLRSAPEWAEHLTLCSEGVVLGKGTVIAGLVELPFGGTGLDLDGREGAVLALLSLACRALAPVDVLEKLASVSRALSRGDASVAAIALAQLGQPPLTDEALAKSLNVAADRLKLGEKPLDLLCKAGFAMATLRKVFGQTETWRKLNPNHVPAGCPEGGQFCSGNAGYDPTYGGALPEPKLPSPPSPFTSWDAYLARNPDVPDYKADVVDEDDFHDFNRAATELPGQTDTQTYCFRETFAAEGGMDENKSGVVAGIKQQTLDDAIDAGAVDENTTMKNMTPEQAATLYHYQLDYCLERVGGSAALDGVGDKQAAAALCDTLFQFGDNGGADVIRRAVDAVTGKSSEETGRLGKGYYEKYCQLAQNPQTRQALSDKLAEQRTIRAERVNRKEVDYDRIQHFTFK